MAAGSDCPQMLMFLVFGTGVNYCHLAFGPEDHRRRGARREAPPLHFSPLLRWARRTPLVLAAAAGILLPSHGRSGLKGEYGVEAMVEPCLTSWWLDTMLGRGDCGGGSIKGEAVLEVSRPGLLGMLYFYQSGTQGVCLVNSEASGQLTSRLQPVVVGRDAGEIWMRGLQQQRTSVTWSFLLWSPRTMHGTSSATGCFGPL